MAEGHGSGEEETGVVVIDTGKRNNRRVVQHVILVNGWQGPCVVYTADSVQFKVPLAFLSTTVFAELLRMSNEEFGFTGSNGRITLPCDAVLMEYAMCLLGRNASAEMEAAFLRSMAMPLPCHYDASCVAPHLGVGQHVAVCSS